MLNVARVGRLVQGSSPGLFSWGSGQNWQAIAPDRSMLQCQIKGRIGQAEAYGQLFSYCRLLALTISTPLLPRASPASFSSASGLRGSRLVKNTSSPFGGGGTPGILLSRDPPSFVACDWPEHWPLSMTRVRPFPAVAIAMGSFRLFPYRDAVSELSESERVRESERPDTRRASTN